MAGKSPVKANDKQRAELRELSRSDDRGEADRARAILLTLKGWTSPAIAAVFCVITLHEVRRVYDDLTWPHASRGFFNLKKKIPDILEELQRVSAPRLL